MLILTFLFLFAANPFKFAVDVYHGVIHFINSPVDVVEYVTGKPLHKTADVLHSGASKVDEFVDKLNHEKTPTPQVKIKQGGNGNHD